MAQRFLVRFLSIVFLICLLPGVSRAAATEPSTTANVVDQGPPPIPRGTLAERAQSLFGLVVFTFLAWGIGRATGARTRVPTRTIVWGILLQFAFGAVIVWNRSFLVAINDAVDALLAFTLEGAKLVFGDLASENGVAITNASGTIIGYGQSVGYFAFFVLPTIVFFSCLTAVAYHTGVMQFVVQGFAWIMSKGMGTSGAETLSSAANIFVGQTEAPLMIRPFVATATNSELMAIMVGGFANIASGVLGLYTIWLKPFLPDAAGHLAAACFITAPGSLLVAKLLMPEAGKPITSAGVQFKVDKMDANLVDAAARGTSDGLGLAINVGAMLISFTALVALADALLGWGGSHIGISSAANPLTLESILGYVFRPLAWLCGVSWSECRPVGTLLGIKTVLNELIAYDRMRQALTANPHYLSPRATLLATYGLCGFANFASVGIQVGGISTIAPNRRGDLSRLGMTAMVGGAISSLMAACVVGILI